MEQTRYTPWWMPAIIVVLILLSLSLIAALALKTEQSTVTDISTDNVTDEQQVYHWDLVTTWPENFPGLGLAPENFAKLVAKMSDGRLLIDVHGANTLVPALGVFDAVSAGSVEMGHSAAYYWKGKIAAAPFFTTIPFGMNVQEFNGWLHYGGGLELWREIYAPYNLIPFAGGNTGVQMGGWFNKEINSLDDIDGLKMRIPGLGGEVFSRVGGTAVNIPGGELYTALQSGVIDATEWVGPYNDLAFGFHQIAKYYYYPGWHEPGPALEFIVNKDAYARLPQDLQAIVEVATRAINQDMLDEYTQRSSGALAELKNIYNVDIRPFPEDVLDSFYHTAQDIYQEYSDNDPQFKKVADSYFSYMEKARDYSDISERAYYDVRSASAKNYANQMNRSANKKPTEQHLSNQVSIPNSIDVHYVCNRTEKIRVNFGDKKARLTMGDDVVELPHQPTESGFYYTNGQLAIRGQGVELSLEIGKMAPIACQLL